MTTRMAEVFDRINCRSRGHWLEARHVGIGGSDASAIVGANPWKTSERLWEEKIGLAEQPDISNEEAVRYGVNAEGSLRQLFRLDFPEYKLQYRNNQLLRNKALPWMQASLDGELTAPDKRKGILEIKTTSILQSMQREKWNDQIPQNYYIQCLHYLLVTGYQFVILKAQLKSVWDDEVRLTTKHYTIERTNVEADLRYLIKQEIQFWKHVENKVRPPLALPAI